MQCQEGKGLEQPAGPWKPITLCLPSSKHVTRHLNHVTVYTSGTPHEVSTVLILQMKTTRLRAAKGLGFKSRAI